MRKKINLLLTISCMLTAHVAHADSLFWRGDSAGLQAQMDEAAAKVPEGATRGTISSFNRGEGYAYLNGTAIRLAPGFWLKSVEGRILREDEWTGGEVFFWLDLSGQLWRARATGRQ